MEAVLEENGFKAFIYSDIPQPATADAQLLDAWTKNIAKARRISLEGV